MLKNQAKEMTGSTPNLLSLIMIESKKISQRKVGQEILNKNLLQLKAKDRLNRR